MLLVSRRLLCAAAVLACDALAPVRTQPRARGRLNSFKRGFGEALLLVSLVLPVGLLPAPAEAKIMDTAAVGKCVLSQCQLPLAKCITNPKCLANLVCINTCTGRDDESECQIRCGDLFENAVVGEFNACAVSQKKCVPQRGDDGAYPVPPASAVQQKFDTKIFEGRWYISAGLNPTFDIFDCQVHFFSIPSPGTLYGKLNWRIAEPDGEFFTRDVIQRFVQDKEQQGVLYNHDNDYLHYQDDWYILDSDDGKNNPDSDDAFVLVYYRGRNDAWDGYGGAVLYTRTRAPSAKVEAKATAAAAKIGLKYSEFAKPDNSCSDQKTGERFALREKFAGKAFLTAEKELQEEATSLRRSAKSTFEADSKEVNSATTAIERLIEQYEQGAAAEVVAVEKSIENDIVAAEKLFAKDLQIVEDDVVAVEQSVVNIFNPSKKR